MRTLLPDRPKPFALLADARTFLRSTVEILFRPRRFFAAALGPQPGAQSREALRPLPPFKHLGMGIGLATLAAPLHQAMLRAGGFPERWIELANRSPQDMLTDFTRMTGRHMALVDLSALTGVALLDEPIEDAARAATYALLAALFALWSGFRLKTRPVMTYFAYAFGAMLVLGVLGNLASDLMFLMLSGGWESRTMKSGILSQVVDLVRLGFILVMPSVLFPALLGVPRGIVIRATVLAVLTWGIGGVLLAHMMMASGFVILGPGL